MDGDIQEIYLNSVFSNIHLGVMIIDITSNSLYLINQQATNILDIDQKLEQPSLKDINNIPLRNLIEQITLALRKGDDKEITEIYLDKDSRLTAIKSSRINGMSSKDGRQLLLFQLERSKLSLQAEKEIVQPFDAFKLINYFQQSIEKIEQEKKTLEIYLDMLTHDLNNDFQVLKGYLEEIRTLSNGKTKDTFIRNIYVRTLHSHMLLGNIAALMKTAYSTPIILNVFEIVEKIEMVRDQLLHMFPKKNIQVSTSIQTSNKSIRVDPLFNQMVLNILTNAVKNDNHEIINIDVIIRSANNKIILEFIDYGKGIAPARKKQLFERYSTFKKQGEGTGLGLHIIRSLVNKYNGELSVENRISGDYTKGTKIIIKIPLKQV